jgi:GT2 family glycosyltransferase
MGQGSPLTYAVVLGWNHRKDTAECVSSILESDYSNLHVMVVDNASTDGAPDFLSRLFPTVRIVRLERNLGITGGYNVGMELAFADKAKYVVLLNNDTVVEKDFISQLVLAAEADPEAGILAPKILLYDNPGTIWSAGARWRCLPPGIVQFGLGYTDGPRFNQSYYTDYATSCAWLVRAEVFGQVGGFDPDYSFYFSDYEYCARVRGAGYQIRFVPGARMCHKVSLSTQRGDKPAHWWYQLGKGEARFYRQYLFLGRLLLLGRVLWMVLRESIQGNSRYLFFYVKGALGLGHSPDL